MSYKAIGIITTFDKMKAIFKQWKVDKINLQGSIGSKIPIDGVFNAVVTGYNPLVDVDTKQALNFVTIKVKVGESVIEDSFLSGDSEEKIDKPKDKIKVERRFNEKRNVHYTHKVIELTEKPQAKTVVEVEETVDENDDF